MEINYKNENFILPDVGLTVVYGGNGTGKTYLCDKVKEILLKDEAKAFGYFDGDRLIMNDVIELLTPPIERTSSLIDSLIEDRCEMSCKIFYRIKDFFEYEVAAVGTTIILDMPEILLDPQRQLMLAEVLVSLADETGCHIIVTTKSPYFLCGLKTHSNLYKLKNCSFFEIKTKKECPVLLDCDFLDILYEDMMRPLRDLENLAWGQIF